MGTPVTVTTVGAGSFTIPANVTSITVEGWGGGGRGGPSKGGGGGGGAYIAATIAVSPGDVIYWVVGAGTGGSETTWFRRNVNSPTNAWFAGGGGSTGGTGGGTAGNPTNGTDGTLVASFSGAAGAAAQGGGGSRGGSGGGGAGGPSGAGAVGSSGSSSNSGAGGAGNNGTAAGGTSTTTDGIAGTSHVDGGGGASGGGGGAHAGGVGGAPGGGGGGAGSGSATQANGGRGQIRYQTHGDEVYSGSERSGNLISNGRFLTSTTGWTASSGFITLSRPSAGAKVGGRLRITANNISSSGDGANFTITGLTNGARYMWTARLSGTSNGVNSYNIGPQGGLLSAASTNNGYIGGIWTATGTSVVFGLKFLGNPQSAGDWLEFEDVAFYPVSGLVPNGQFTDGVEGWTPYSASSLDHVGSALRIIRTSTGANISAALVDVAGLTDGTQYVLSGTVSGNTLGSWAFADWFVGTGPSDRAVLPAPSTGEITYNFTASGTTAQILVGVDHAGTKTVGDYVTFDNITLVANGISGARTETITASDSATATQVHNVSHSESITASHSQTSTATFPNTRSESVTATDSPVGGLLQSATRSESVTASDSATSLHTHNATRAESVTATDSIVSTTTYTVSLTESITATDDATSEVITNTQFLRPDGQISTGSWTNDWSTMDETIADDGDFAYSQDNPNGSIFEVSLSDPTAGDPDVGTYTVRYRHAQVLSGVVDGTGTPTALDAMVVQGTTIIATDAQQAPGGSWVTREWTPDLSSITDWTDVRLRFTASGGAGNPASRRGVAVSWAELEAPNHTGTAYNVTRTESITASDSSTTTVAFAETLTESLTATDGVTVTGSPTVSGDRLTTESGGTLQFTSSIADLTVTNTDVTDVVFSIHGLSRVVANAYDNAYDGADVTGTLHNTLVIAPFFRDTAGIGTDLYWTTSGWSEGSKDASTYDYSSFAAIDDFITYLVNSGKFPNLARVTVVGHSAGGQFAHRYGLGNVKDGNTPGVSFRYVVMNPGSYTYLNEFRWNGSSWDTPVTSGYDDYKYGLAAGLNAYLTATGATALRNQYIARDVHYLAGTLDNDPNDPDLDVSAPAAEQGAHRYERAVNYFAHLNNYYAHGHTFNAVPGVAHSSSGMYGSDAARRLVFRGTNRVDFVEAAAANVTSTSTTVAVPTNRKPGHLILLVVETGGGTSYATPTGYTPFTTNPVETGAAATDTQLNLYWRIVDGSEASVPIQVGSDVTQAQTFLFRGVSATAPLESVAASVLTSASTAVSIDAITTQGPNRQVVAVVTNTKDSTTAPTSGWTNGTLVGFAQIGNRNTNTLNGGGYAVASGRMVSAGSTGTITATLDTASIQSKMAFAITPYGTYVETLSESITASESSIGGLLTENSVTESITASDSSTTTATFPNSLTESVTATDSNVAANTMAATRSESATASDSATSAATFPNTRTESVTAGDSRTAAKTTSATRAESITASHNQTSVATFPNARTESATASDSATATQTMLASRSESITATDSAADELVSVVTGEASGSLDLTGTSAGAVLNPGAASGTLDLSGTSAGVVAVVGATAGTLDLTGSSAGQISTNTVFASAAGTLDFTGASAGVSVIAGTATDTFDLTGASAGEVDVSGLAAGTLPLAGSASSGSSVNAVGTGTLDLTGSSTAALLVQGSASGTLDYTNASEGEVPSQGTGSASLDLTGSASGTVAVSGSASGDLDLTGAATASAISGIIGTADATLGFTGTSVGNVTLTGATAGTLDLTGTSAGQVAVAGQAAGTFEPGGNAAGVVAVAGASAGTLGFTGSSTATTETITTGAAAGTLDLTGNSAGTVALAGDSAGDLPLTGASVGVVPVAGASAGSLGFTGSAAGTNVVSGAGTGSFVISGSATAAIPVAGAANDNLDFTGSASGTTPVAGTSSGTLDFTGSATAEAVFTGGILAAASGTLVFAGHLFGRVGKWRDVPSALTSTSRNKSGSSRHRVSATRTKASK